MHYPLIALHLAALAWATMETYFDALWTNHGLKALPQEAEGSGFVNFFARTNRPTFRQIFWIETLGHNLPLGLLGLLLLSSNPSVWPWSGFGTAGLVVVAIGHIQGAKAWKKLLGVK